MVTTELHEYLKSKRRFNKCVLAWMSKPPSSYQPNLVREFFANYLVLLQKDDPKGVKLLDFPNREQVPVRGVNIDILAQIFNRILFEPEYEAPPIVVDLEYRLTSVST